MDFISGHHGAIPASCMKSPGQIEHALLRRAKSEMVAAALANGCVPAHNVTLDLKDTYKTYQDEKRAREEFGYLRMWSIYPAQIQPIVDAMAPNFGEVQRASEILLAAQKGVVSRTPSACPPLGFDKLVRPADRRLIRRPELDRKKASHDQVSS